MSDVVKAGAIYDTESRKGKLTIQLIEDVDLHEDTFFQARIIEGTARYLSEMNRAAQKAFGQGTQGDIISFRTSLCHFRKRRKDLEDAVAKAQEEWANKHDAKVAQP